MTKEWVGKAGSNVTINLLADGNKVKSVVLNEENNWQHTFVDLDKYKDGKEIVYTVSEEKLEGYDTEISGNVNDGFVVKNTNTEKISVPVEKQWVGRAVDKAEIILLANGEEADRITLNEENSWKHTFKDLAKYDSKTGEEIKYTLSEVAVEGYSTSITGNQETGFTVTNTEKKEDKPIIPENKPMNPDENNDISNSKPNTSPKTGDITNIGVLWLIFIGSGGTLLGLNRKKYKK